MLFDFFIDSAQALPDLHQSVSKLALEEDHRYADGWFFGQFPRVFKSGYGKLNPSLKASFALDYDKMLESKKQNLVKDFSSYVPYSERLTYSREWWRKADKKGLCKYCERTDKEKLIWLHESILDASELVFRVKENKNPGKTSSYAILAHDKEQDMVSHYTEVEGRASTFSKLYSEWKGKL